MAITAVASVRTQSAEVGSARAAGLLRAGAICALFQAGWLGLMLVVSVGVGGPLNFETGAADPAGEITALKTGADLYGPLMTFVTIASAMLGVVVVALFESLRWRSPGLVSVASLFGSFAAFSMLLANGLGYAVLNLVRRPDGHAPPLDTLAASLPAVMVGTAERYGIGLFMLGLWIGLLSLRILRDGGLPRWVAYLGW